MVFPAKHISVSINADPRKVYQYASDPFNMPDWAGGLSGSIKKDGQRWIADSPMGKVTVQFSPINDFGVIDHDVTFENGKKFHNPLRVLHNGNGSEVVFTLYRQPEMSDDDFTRDANMILKDLKKLKELIEKDHS